MFSGARHHRSLPAQEELRRSKRGLKKTGEGNCSKGGPTAGPRSFVDGIRGANCLKYVSEDGGMTHALLIPVVPAAECGGHRVSRRGSSRVAIREGRSAASSDLTARGATVVYQQPRQQTQMPQQSPQQPPQPQPSPAVPSIGTRSRFWPCHKDRRCATRSLFW